MMVESPPGNVIGQIDMECVSRVFTVYCCVMCHNCCLWIQSLLLQGEAGPHWAVHGPLRNAQRTVLGLSVWRHWLSGQFILYTGYYMDGIGYVCLFFHRLRLMPNRRRRSLRRRSSGLDSVRRCSRMPTTSSSRVSRNTGVQVPVLLGTILKPICEFQFRWTCRLERKRLCLRPPFLW